MQGRSFIRSALPFALALGASAASAALVPSYGVVGNVGLSVDGIGSNNATVGTVQAEIPVSATILKAFLYTAGTPFPWYSSSPTTLDAYNSAGITLAGNAITNYDTLVGAVSTRPELGQWFTARADVTSLVQSLVVGAATSSFSWAMAEGGLNQLIDGSVLAVVYSDASLPTSSVVLLDGGQATGGETTDVLFSTPIGDPSDPTFFAHFGIASSFSCCSQASRITVNGDLLTNFAGNNDDGLTVTDGSLLTVGGLGDDPANNVGSYAEDDELYDLSPFLAAGDAGFSINTFNATNDANIFLAHLHTTALIDTINDDPIDDRDVNDVPEPGPFALVGIGLLGLLCSRRQKH